MEVPDPLRALLDAIAPSGHEEPAARIWRESAARFARVEVDALGSSYARVGAPDAGCLAIVAHIDEIGFQITHVDESGMLAIGKLGGFSPELLLGQRVVIAAGEATVDGVVARREAGERADGDRAALKLSDLHIDIGAGSYAEALAHVRPGDAGVWRGDLLELGRGRIVSRALDNRLGAYAALEAAHRLAADGGAPLEVVAVAPVQEEIGGFSGSRTAAYALEPTVALALDVTYATDVPGGDPRRAGKVELGSGAAITRSPVVHPGVFELLVSVAEREGIPYTVEVYAGRTNTDADAVRVVRAGVPTGLVSIPLRYMHSPCELASLDDLEAVIALVVAFARALAPGQRFTREGSAR